MPLDDTLMSEKWEFIKNIIEDKRIKKICFNTQSIMRSIFFELGHKIVPQQIYDPSVATWLVESELESYKFSDCLQGILEKPAEKREKWKSNLSSVIKDFTNCVVLWEKMEDMLKEQKLMEPLEHEMKIAIILAKMENVGVSVDPDGFQKYTTLIESSLAEIDKEVEEIVGHPVKLSSPKEVAIVIYDELHLVPSSVKIKMTTSKKSRSTAEDVLIGMISAPFIRLLLSYRKMSKYLSVASSFRTFAKKSEEKGHPIYRIHPHWIHQGSSTGRLSCRDPNLQNLSTEPMVVELDERARPKLAINVRDSLTCKQGSILLAADYSQIEFRVLAHLCKDEKLKEFLETDQDIHSLVASYILDRKIENVLPQERNFFKEVVFGILYGMSPTALGAKLKMPTRQAAQFIHDFFDKFPKIATFINDTRWQGKDEGYIATLLGRRRTIVGDRSDYNLAARKAVNSVVQGSAADILKLAMIKMDENLLKEKEKFEGCDLVLQIHDELVYEVPIEKLEFMKALVKETMENACTELLVPLKVVMKTGTKFGSMQRIVDLRRENIS
jgi:DNA polymerase-1